ncbi:NADP-dependent oxidoreductase [Limosilactobacillus sp. STM2_1]|uniref:NADP-dependent oxidoreductase n=1 Tax=Limosilactobacillus rudii TaxID=2759755 RepID=A0A7W3YMJ9_9LACO|nr:NADP-dependent oxidoreductase [Limosilactobacillus rudii]MBB1097544.1 NADP-dependent oxidoreductase [Limosilactobacillus rudii]MCD7134654.1 NADP-dependent oxidoreductase [Limosilactobacillus rudii]
MDSRTATDPSVRFLLNYHLPHILGNDFAGEIVATNPNSKFKKGQRVFGLVNYQNIGTFAEFIAVDEKDIALIPDNISYQEAAITPLVSLTAYQALHDLMKLKKGQKIFIEAGAGGVGSVAIILAKRFGAYVATTAGNGSEFVKKLGADKIIDYHKEDFSTLLHNYDAALISKKEDLEKAFKILRPNGNLVTLNGIPTQKTIDQLKITGIKKFLLNIAAFREKHLAKKTHVNFNFLFVQANGQELSKIATLLEKQELKINIAKIYSLDNLVTAMKDLDQHNTHGKIVIQIN